MQYAQQARLRFQRHVADLVQEQRAAFGLFEAADAAIGRPGKGAALMAEQFAFDELLGDRSHVDRDEGAVAPLAVIVQRPRDEFLARAAFAHDHDREIGLGQPRDDAVDLLHRPASGRSAATGLRCAARR
ncbi:MAG: hypothetical protein WDM81_09230 [Rhizomicrobium sp.]